MTWLSQIFSERVRGSDIDTLLLLELRSYTAAATCLPALHVPDSLLVLEETPVSAAT
jgi:hypothetical protein